jgi:hypothetical protein
MKIDSNHYKIHYKFYIYALGIGKKEFVSKLINLHIADKIHI